MCPDVVPNLCESAPGGSEYIHSIIIYAIIIIADPFLSYPFNGYPDWNGVYESRSEVEQCLVDKTIMVLYLQKQ